MNPATLSDAIQPLMAPLAEPVRAEIEALIVKFTQHIGEQEKRIAILE